MTTNSCSCVHPIQHVKFALADTKANFGLLCGRVVHWFKNIPAGTAQKTDRLNPYVVCIAGGTGSGKTTLAHKIQSALGKNAVIIDQDSYYRDLRYQPFHEREQTNFDHPGSIDFDCLCHDINAMKHGQNINKPIYNFKLHAREDETTPVNVAPVVIIEGILVLTNKKLRDLSDLKIYVDTDDDVRVLRRIERDIAERGRDFGGVKLQYLTTVKPMHNQFVESSKRYADVTISGERDSSAIVNKIIDNLRKKI